ncbi:MAG: hypothetical protein RL113_387 [Pseudomonadota bacterium]
MAVEKPSLLSLLEHAQGKKILFLGRERLFTKEEIIRFLKKYGIEIVKNLEEGVIATVEHSSLNPVEEEISNDAYSAKIPSYGLEALEKLLSETMNEDELLMGIKLSNDQERIFRLLGNAHIPESLFIKLLMLYQWHDEEDDRNDRDVIMYTLKRYIDIKPNEADLLYSYLTLRRLATEAVNPQLLFALVGFPNFSFLIRGKEKITLRETIARNEYLDEALIAKLVSLRDEKVDVALGGNLCVDLERLHILFGKKKTAIYHALATNKSIDHTLFEGLLHQDDKTIQLLLLSQPINQIRLESIQKVDLGEDLMAVLGANESLHPKVIETLITQNNEAILIHLSANPILQADQLEKILAKDIPSTYPYLALNPSLPQAILTQLYETAENQEILVSLAHNKNTPEAILRSLFARDEFKINEGLASNPSVPMELLDVLKVDTRLQHALAMNEVFIKEYETVLDYDKKAVQF